MSTEAEGRVLTPPIFTVRHSATRRVLLTTDDWIEAHHYAMTNRPARMSEYLEVVGVHPSHDFGDGRYNAICSACGSWNNGSYGSQAPCGYKFTASLHATVMAEMEARNG